MCASACNRLTGSLSKTRWSFGTRETHATQRIGHGRGPGSVPAGVGNRRGAEVSAAAKAGGDSPEEAGRRYVAVLPAGVCMDLGGRSGHNRGIFWHALRSIFSANAAAEAGPD